MEAGDTLLNIVRGVPEVFDSCFDVRVLVQNIYYLIDKKKQRDIGVPCGLKVLEHQGLKQVHGTYLEQLLRDAKLV